MNQRILRFLPQIDYEEALMLDQLTQNLSDEALQNFAGVYSARRKDPQLVLLLALLGFVGLAGVHRFVLGQIGMGILYILTAGLCFIGTIVDLINYKQLALEFNRKTAHETLMMLNSMNR
ncbi:MAG: TM2 domain-containing protein [Bacteroidales bacterium]